MTATGAGGRCIAAPALRGNYVLLTFSADGRTVYAGRGDGFEKGGPGQDVYGLRVFRRTR